MRGRSEEGHRGKAGGEDEVVDKEEIAGETVGQGECSCMRQQGSRRAGGSHALCLPAAYPHSTLTLRPAPSLLLRNSHLPSASLQPLLPLLL